MRRLRSFRVVLTLLAMVAPGGKALAGEADVVGVEARRSGDAWSFSVSVRHADTGWDHYANRWEIVGPDDEVLGTRKLLHPHVDEQPFTRSLADLRVPDGATWVRVRAHDSVHGLGGREMTIDLETGVARPAEAEGEAR